MLDKKKIIGRTKSNNQIIVTIKVTIAYLYSNNKLLQKKKKKKKPNS
jgi:hypothetical protein